ncbi:MAG: PQQ-binding-like beta-propeller repeat protein [Verrucomicrobiota bacterium]
MFSAHRFLMRLPVNPAGARFTAFGFFSAKSWMRWNTSLPGAEARGAKAFRTMLCGLLLGSVFSAGAEVFTLTNEWSLNIDEHSDSAPAIGTDGTIFVGTSSGSLWAINGDGTRKWVFRAQNEIKSSPAVGLDGTVYFGSRDRRFYAVRSDGKKRWEFKTGAWVDSSPALARDGAVFFGSWDHRFYALNPDGSKKWQFQTLGPIVSSPAIGADGTVYFGSHDKKFYAVAADGRKKWEFITGGPIISSPALGNDQCLYFTSVDGCLYALEPDGRLRWRLRTGGITESSPVIGLDGTIYVGVVQHLWAIKPDGQKKWGRASSDADNLFESSPIVFADRSICGISRYGMLMNFDPEQNMPWTYYLYGYGYGSPAVGPTGTLYVPDCGAGAGGKGFSALRATVPLAHSPWPKFRGNARNTGNIQDASP